MLAFCASHNKDSKNQYINNKIFSTAIVCVTPKQKKNIKNNTTNLSNTRNNTQTTEKV
jgi:hypothetical protein